MKLLVQIPCLNEEKTLPLTVRSVPREIDGIDQLELLVIDDGSSDSTSQVARELGVDHVIRFTSTKGLARGFMAGIDTCLKLGADIIVTIDGDNQYKGEDIPRLIEPILDGRADVVVGTRDIDSIPHFSPMKKRLEKLGSWVVKRVSKTDIPDAPSGFRAYSREAALRTNVISNFTYTLETLIQAGRKNITVTSVPVATNEKLRESRLFTSTASYVKKSIATILRIYMVYEPLRIFFWIGAVVFSLGFLFFLRFMYFYFTVPGNTGHVQSLILSAVLLIVGFQIVVIGLLADLSSANRQLVEDALFRIKKLELTSRPDDDSEQTRE